MMRNMTWIKKGFVCGLAAVCFMMGFGTVQAEAGFGTLTIRKEALKERAASKGEEKAESSGKEQEGSVKEQELAAKEQELEQLRKTKVSYMISCTYCGGSGKSAAACKYCSGKGIADIPGNLSLVMSCGHCMGSGKEKCAMCMNGKMVNPDYSEQCEVRDGKIKKLEDEIAQMKETSGDSSFSDSTLKPEPIPSPNLFPDNPTDRISVDCVNCKGTGRVTCSSCKGAGYLEKTNWTAGYSGSGSKSYTTKISCSCDSGSRICIYCGGDGKR